MRLPLALLLLAPAAAAQPAPAWAPYAGDTLRLSGPAEAVRMALDGSPEVAIEREGVRFAEARARQARAARFLTEFTVTTGHAIAPGLANVPEGAATDSLYLLPGVENDWSDAAPYNEVTVDALQPLWTWGELSGQIRAARAAVGVERAEAEEKRAEVALRAAELYVSLAAAQAAEALALEAASTLDRARGELEALRDDPDAGVGPGDIVQLRLFEQELVRRGVEVREGQATAQGALARQLLRPGAAVRAAPLAPFAFARAPLEAYWAEALARRPVLARAAAGERARRALVSVARSRYYPKLFLGVTYRGRYAPNRYRQDNPYISDSYLGSGLRAGLGIRQDLAFGQTRARVQQAEAEHREVQHQRHAAEQLVLAEVEQAYRDLVAAEAALAAADTSVQIAGEWLRAEQIDYDLELGDARTLVAAARADLEVRVGRVDAVRRYNTAVLRLLARTGALADAAVAGTLFEQLPDE